MKVNNSTMSTSPAPVAEGAGVTDGKDDGDRGTSEDAPANAVDVVPKKKEPPPESPASIRIRVLVLASFWAIVIIVGLPIWWSTTNIYRANLPLDQMMDWADGRVGGPLGIASRHLANTPRHVDLSSPCGYRYKRIPCKGTRPSICCEQRNMRWMT